MRRRLWTVMVVLGVVGANALALADVVKLKDGTAFPGRVVQKDAENVVVVVPRSAVASVDGQPMPPPVGVGAMAPEFSVTDLSGKTHTLSSYRGKPVVLLFWATWCPHCRSDVAMMNQLYQQYKKDVGFITVSFDRDPKKLAEYIAAEKIEYPVIDGTTPGATGAALPALYEADGVPHYFVITAEGAIAAVTSGSFTESSRSLDDLIKPVLASGGKKS